MTGLMHSVIFRAGLAMALVGYAIKMIPLVFFKKPIQNKFIASFLKYVPYAVLTSMVVPEVFQKTGAVQSAVVGVIVAIILALMNQGLLVVSLAATVAVFITERIMKL